uniref:alpha/beta fold hydrolase n=1 Tax=Acetatifactor sp. TaxID=1872090 RepID=UPI00405708DB
MKLLICIAMCYPINPLKRAATKGATRTETGYKNMMDMIAPYKKREYCHLMQIAYDALLQDNKDLNISCPVLITYGEYDKTGKVRHYCKKWHEQTNYPLQIIKNAGHNANVDNPEEMNSIIEEFLEEKVLCS